MAGKWREAKIEEVSERVAMGPFGSSIKVETFVPSGIPVISGQHLHGSKVDDRIRFNFVSEAHADRLRNANVQRGDVIFTHAGNIGQVAFVPKSSKFERYVISQRQFYMRCNLAKVIPEFVVAYFKTPEGQHRLLANTSQVGVPSIAQPVSYLRKIEIPLPPLPEQGAIAHILGAFDDKLELNRSMNETLGSIAQALFQSWFVDFDPVRAKAEGRDTGLPKHLADLFPDSFQDSEVGTLPNGWEWRQLGELVDLTRGRTYKSGLKGIPGPVLLGLGAIERNGGFRDDKLVTYGGDAPKELLLGPGELFASLKDVTQSADLLGAVARVPGHVGCGRLTQDTVKLCFRFESSSREIVYRTLLTPEYREYCRAHATGTTNLGLSRDDFLAYPIVCPGEKLQRAFDTLCERLSNRAALATDESRTLVTLRDALLPMLISGELRLSVTARTAEHVD